MLKKIPAKSISIFVLVFSICTKAALDYFFATLDTDKLYQALATINLAHGHGLAVANVHAVDLSQVVFEPLFGWPMGYSVILYPFYTLVTQNMMICCLCVDFLFITLFLIVLRKLLLLLGFPGYLVNIMVLFNGLAIPDYMVQSTPTDLPAMALCLWSCYLLILFVKNPANKSGFGIMIGLINAMAGFMRYLYIPLSFIIPVFLAWNAIQKKDRRLLIGSLYSLLATGISLFLFFSVQRHYTGNFLLSDPALINPSEKGFFISNLQYTHPLVISSILDLNFYFTQLSIHTGIPYGSWIIIARITGLVLLLPLFYVFLGYCVRKRMVWKTNKDVFFMTAGLICVASFVLLCYLSVTNSLVTNSVYFRMLTNFKWTYVQEGRYFPFISIFLQVFFAWAFFIYKPLTFKKTLNVLRIVAGIVITIQILHGIYFIAKESVPNRKNDIHVAAALNDSSKHLINALVKDNHEKNVDVVFASTNSDFCSWSALCGGNALYHIDELNKFVIGAARPTLLVVVLKEGEEPFFSAFFSKNGIHKTMSTGSYNLFTYYILPRGLKQG